MDQRGLSCRGSCWGYTHIRAHAQMQTRKLSTSVQHSVYVEVEGHSFRKVCENESNPSFLYCVFKSQLLSRYRQDFTENEKASISFQNFCGRPNKSACIGLFPQLL